MAMRPEAGSVGASLPRNADHHDWLGRVALFEASRSEEDDHHYIAEARRHHAEGRRLREMAVEAERAGS